MKKSKLTAALLALALLSGCSQQSAISGEASQQSAIESVTQSAEESETPSIEDSAAQSDESSETQSAEESETESTEGTYMEKCEEMLTELAPKEILIERDGIEYPKFEKYTYYSSTAERDTPVNVLLPTDYSEDKEYPVVYILHGYYDSQDWMTRDIVHISTMLTNLIVDGEAKEMIVVCPYIFCSKELPSCTGMDDKNTLAYDNFINDMMTDLMPFINKTFSVSEKREDTAITGFSMGGRESLFIGISHPEIFGYIGAVCAAPGLVNGTGSPWQLEREQLTFGDIKPKLLLLSASNSDGTVGNNPAQYRAMFIRNGEELVWHLMSNTGHDPSSVTPHLYNYFRMIFN